LTRQAIAAKLEPRTSEREEQPRLPSPWRFSMLLHKDSAWWLRLLLLSVSTIKSGFY